MLGTKMTGIFKTSSDNIPMPQEPGSTIARHATAAV
jgi:hypothetical protein